jgi:Ser/Thr protein kinase RdoA (MazF antagonist)
MEGDVMADTPAAYTPQTRYSVGVMVGRLAKSLRNFYHPYARSNDHLWDMARCLELRPYVRHLSDTSTQDLCNRLLDRAESFILPQAWHCWMK